MRLIFIRFVYFSVANIVYIDKQIVWGNCDSKRWRNAL